jgi:hypothetical protein
MFIVIYKGSSKLKEKTNRDDNIDLKVLKNKKPTSSLIQRKEGM